MILLQAEAEGSDGEAGEGGDDTDKEPDAASDAAPVRSAPYVHLACVHCKEKCPTFSVSSVIVFQVLSMPFYIMSVE